MPIITVPDVELHELVEVIDAAADMHPGGRYGFLETLLKPTGDKLYPMPDVPVLFSALAADLAPVRGKYPNGTVMMFPAQRCENGAAMYRYDVKAGVFVCSVEPGSAAEEAGLKMGDVITKVDDAQIRTVEDLNLAKKKYSAGDAAKLEVYRPDGTVTLDLTWGAAPKEEQGQQQVQQGQGDQNNGNYYSGGGNGGYDPFDMFRYFFG